MSKAVEGAAMLGLAAGMFAFAVYDPEMFLNPYYLKTMEALALGGISMEAGAIAQALTQNRGANITTRQPASYRQIIRGEQRVGGVEIYRNTTGGKHDQFNYVIVLATHIIDSIVNLYLDGRQVHWQVGSNGNIDRNGVNFGGHADGNSWIGPNGAHYNFGTLVYCEARFGDQVDGDVMGSLTANDPNWAPSSGGSPWVGGCAYVYLKVEYDTAMFPGEPEIRFTVRGKNDILDPRTGTTGYTTNWALHVADHLSDPIFGINDATAVNQAQLIAAANVCDEQVTLANTQTEARYCLHMHYDTSISPGDVLSQMMPAAIGRISRIGGEWYIWPSYWQGASFSFDHSMLLVAPTYNPVRSYRDLANRITGTYTAPNFPWNVAGNLYDSNGWYYGTLQDNFPYAFQPSSFPMYAADTLHGYAFDQYLEEDGGVQLPQDLSLITVLSIAQAQRCAKVQLMRNRQQGMATFTMGLAAWEMQPADVMQFSFPAMSWVNKLFEISSVELKIAAPPKGEQDFTSDDDKTLSIYVVVTAIETDPSVYAWSTAEELTPYDVPGALTFAPYTPAVPPNVVVTSSQATCLIGADGVVTPRALITWGAPPDILVTQVQIQYQAPGSDWVDGGRPNVATGLSFITGLIAGHVYNFRIASVRGTNGAMSDWVEQDALTVSMTLSSFANTAVQSVAPAGTLSTAYASGFATITVQPFTAQYGQLSASCLSGAGTTLLGLAPATFMYVYYVDPTFAGGAIVPHATTNPLDFQGRVGYWLIGSIVTAAVSPL
jgi:hypothetical protein